MNDQIEIDRQKSDTSCSITLTDIHKRYRTGQLDVHALRGLNLTIQEPGFYGIMGPSGSGKSTLLHLMAALDRPDRGQISINGFQLDQMSESQLTLFRRKQIGIIFQQFNLIATLTAIENVTLPAMLAGIKKRDRLARGHELLDQLDLLDRANHRPDALSGGQQQRVAIARSLLFNPSVLYADEPTGNLDSASSAQLWSLLGHLAETRNLTVLMVTHEPEAASHCRQLFLLRDGVFESKINTDEMDSAELLARTQHHPGTVGT
ncbi:MAG: ABC transporter ATP-binding protein [Phycisphaerales bacterium]|nr:ABC transporter ATP-binding protein [Phycisphaerales bacterium]